MSDNNSCTIGNKMKDDCNKLTYCKKIGVKKISEYKYEEKLLLGARTGLNLSDASVICYHHKVIPSNHENLQNIVQTH